MALGDTYATLDELKAYLQLTDETEFDERLTDALVTSSKAIERFCGRVFNDAGAASARVFKPTRSGLAFVDDFSTTTGLIIKTDEDEDGVFEQTWTSADYQLEPLNGLRNGMSWPYWQIHAIGPSLCFPRLSNGRATLQVTARWGWSEVPAPVKQACLIMSAETFKLATAPLGVAGMGEFGFIRVRDNRMATGKLNPYVRDQYLVE